MRFSEDMETSFLQTDIEINRQRKQIKIETNDSNDMK